ncbi:MAG: glycosyltransferase family 4 protein [Desulfobaccales bacterium]
MGKPPPRILFFSYHLPRDEEPGAFRPWMEARLLKRAGFEVTAVTSGVHYMTGEDTRKGKGWCTEEFDEGIRILKTWAPTGFRRSILRRILSYLCFTWFAGLAGLLKVGNVDRVFAGTDPIFLMPMVFLVSRLKGAGLVLDERDLYPETAIALGVIREGRLSHLLFGMQQFFRKKAIGILAATPGIREKLQEYGYGEKVQLLYNADVFLDGRPALGTATGSLKQQTGKKFLVGYAGGLGKSNDIWILFRVAYRLRDDLNDLGIVIIGDGENLEAFKGYCGQHHLENVFFLGPKPRSVARELLKEMDICVQPDPQHQFFSLTLASKTFDYHGLGKPTIFCGSGDTVKLLAESGGGLALPPEDDHALAEAIRRLLQDEPWRQRLGTAAKSWFNTHINIDNASAIIKRAMDCEPD